MTNAKFSFTLHNTDGAARTGSITTAHGDIQTPAFMPVGTLGTVKALTTDMVKSTGAGCILGNTYHLMLRPTAERINGLGGLHRFMHWDGPILTDSGGFQVMSLSKLAKVTKHGVTFQSHLDGSTHELTPERSMQIQQLLGSDIVMAFDECTSYPASEQEAAESMLLSIEWAKRCKEAYRPRDGHALFGIVQGSIYRKLRESSAEMTAGLDFDGYAVGGLAVGEGQNLMFNVLDYTVPLLPKDKPRYLMGVGKPDDIVGAVLRGIDMFDCVIPTRSGRNGQAFTRQGVLNIRNSKFADDPEPLDTESDCPASRDYSKAYLHHLVKSDEILGSILMSWHNVDYYQKLMAEIRDAISKGEMQKVAEKYLHRDYRAA